MRAPADASAWLIDEFHRTIDRLPQTFDRERAMRIGTVILGDIGQHAPRVGSRDLFLIYVPEDRLPIAAPLAVELTKRRVSVAFAEYEVASAEQLIAAVQRGLAHHGGGAILLTPAFERAAWGIPTVVSDRLRLVRSPEFVTAVDDLAAWSATLRMSQL